MYVLDSSTRCQKSKSGGRLSRDGTKPLSGSFSAGDMKSVNISQNTQGKSVGTNIWPWWSGIPDSRIFLSKSEIESHYGISRFSRFSIHCCWTLKLENNFGASLSISLNPDSKNFKNIDYWTFSVRVHRAQAVLKLPDGHEEFSEKNNQWAIFRTFVATSSRIKPPVFLKL